MTSRDRLPKHPLSAQLFVFLQYLLPQGAICALVYRAARWRFAPAKNLFIKVFLWLYPVNMAEARIKDPRAYESFNAFFTRQLDGDARPLEGDDDTFVAPADGRLTEYGPLASGMLIQAKGQSYRLSALLGSEAPPDGLLHGEFATIYLAPHNYHRVHMPLAGTLTGMTFIPGRRFSVNQATTALVPDLFARNERVVCWFDTPGGPFAMVLVGALNVASISTHWHGEVTGAEQQLTHVDYQGPQARRYNRGDEMGQFNLGSTVILVTSAGMVRWLDGLSRGLPVRMGQALGTGSPAGR